MPEALKRVEKVKAMRIASKKEATRELADTPTLFAELRQPLTDYLVIPEVSSERRSYIPVGFITKNVIASNLLYVMPDSGIYHFGIMCSAMHMAFVRTVCGRLKSDYRYSAGIVYNNFPWPTPSKLQVKTIEDKAQAVLDARAAYPNSTLADLYAPLAMPPDLTKAHAALDKAVDNAYGYKGSKQDAARVAFLFGLYQKLTAPSETTEATEPTPAETTTKRAPRTKKAKE
jgi:hypothetical protein